MTVEQALEMLLQTIARGAGSGNGCRVMIGTVKEVDEEEYTCIVEREGAPELHDVRLNAVIDKEVKDCFRVIPAKGSYVLVLSMGEATEGVIIGTSLIDRVTIQTGDVMMNVSADGVVMNGGKLGGMIDIAKLTDKVNELADTFNNHTHTIPVGGVVTAGSPSSQTSSAPVTVPAVTSKAKKLNKGDYEDEKVKH
ncbi:hypothetical protein [Bacteroides sp.]